MSTGISLKDCEKRDGANGEKLWVVVDSYVLGLADFVHHHPGSACKIILKRNQVGPDLTAQFLDHFGRTVRAFRDACQQYDARQTPVSLRFPETGPEVEVTIIGKIG